MSDSYSQQQDHLKKAQEFYLQEKKAIEEKGKDANTILGIAALFIVAVMGIVAASSKVGSVFVLVAVVILAWGAIVNTSQSIREYNQKNKDGESRKVTTSGED